MVSRATAERKMKPLEQGLQICTTARKGRKEGGKQQGSHFSPQASHLFDPLRLIPSSNTVLTSKVSPYLQLIKGEFCLSSLFSGIPWPGLEFDLCHSCQQIHFLLLPCFCFYLRQLSKPERKHARTEQGDTGAFGKNEALLFLQQCRGQNC